MDITAGNMAALTARLIVAYNKRLKTVGKFYPDIATIIPSTAGSNFYPRLRDLPGMKEWVGQRVIHALGLEEKFEIPNRTFEQTLAIRREDLEDDQYGFLNVAFPQLAEQAGQLPDKLVITELLEKGHIKKGIDGQYFFDTDHEGYGSDKKIRSWSNILRPADAVAKNGTGGDSPAWYLFCTTQSLKPFIVQTRRPFKVTAITDVNSGAVFNKNQFEWGVDGRCAAGYGLHNLAMRSTAPLNATNLGIAFEMLENQFRADGTPYATKPDAIWVPPSLRSTAQQVINRELIPVQTPDGKSWIPGSNPWKDVLNLKVVQYLNSAVAKD